MSNTEADALSRIKWPKVLSDNVDIDNGCMDTHVINPILTGAVTKSSLIESVSCSAKVIPTELDKETGKLSSINWAKEQRLDPNLGVIIRLIESGQLTKKKLQGKDSSEIKSFLRNKKSLKLVKDVLYRKRVTQTIVQARKPYGNWLYLNFLGKELCLVVMMM